MNVLHLHAIECNVLQEGSSKPKNQALEVVNTAFPVRRTGLAFVQVIYLEPFRKGC